MTLIQAIVVNAAGFALGFCNPMLPRSKERPIPLHSSTTEMNSQDSGNNPKLAVNALIATEWALDVRGRLYKMHLSEEG